MWRDLLRYLLKWLLLTPLVALLAGSASALFLAALDWATATRGLHPGLVWLLPLAGFAVGWLYLRWGRPVEAGNNLLIDEIHQPSRNVPLRMAPMVLLGTVLSHLFGASVGREGTAVQMGGALADQLARPLRLDPQDRRILLMTGIAAGFASVFGTPLAGALFALEVLVMGRLRHHEAWLPCLLAALMADAVGQAWGVVHVHYPMPALPGWRGLGPWALPALLCAGLLFGLAARAFIAATHTLSAWIKQHVAYAPLRPLLGGLLIAGAAWALDGERYLGLGLPVIMQAFEQTLAPHDFLAKLAYTAVSLGSGFKGGEVTPLFYIGATLGNTLASWLPLPLPLLAGLGFVAVFSAAANTPIAGTLMAIELFGADIGGYAALVCAISYLCSGHVSLYHAQRRDLDAP